MDLSLVSIENPDNLNLIMGHAHFIKTVEDLHEAMVNTVPGGKFGLAFCEASGDCLIRTSGTDDGLVELAAKNAEALSAGHTFIIFMRDIFPLSVMHAVKRVPEVARIHCATANPLEVVVVQTELGRGVLGVVDGFASRGIENAEDQAKRKGFLRTIGYKF